MRNESPRISMVAARWMIAGEWQSYPGRAIVAALAVAIGVALGFAVHLVNASALSEFDRAIRTINGESDLQIRGVSPLGFDEALYPVLAQLNGIAGASPVVELPASVGHLEPGRPDVSITLIGLDVLRAVDVTPGLLPGRIAAMGAGAFDDTALFLSGFVLEAMGKSIGDTVSISANGFTREFVIAGLLPGIADGQRIGVVDIAAAQWRFAQLGRLQRVDLRLEQGAAAGRVRAAIASILPPDAEIVTRQSEAQRTDSLSRAYRVNLNMLALMALLSGGFLVYSAQSLSIARRRPQFALLRVLGVQRRALLVQVLAEGAMIGGTGAAAGLALGFAFASGALWLLGGDLGGGYFSGTRPELIFAPGSALMFFLLGVATALAGSLLPAREAAHAQPALALKNAGDAIDPNAVPAGWIAGGFLIAGAIMATLPAIGGLPVFAYLAMASMLAGGVAAMPLIARILLSPLQRRGFRNPAVDLALKRLWGAPTQAVIALCGIVASTSLMIAMAVMVSSFRTAVDDWLVQVLPADLYMYVEGDSSGGLDIGAQQRLTSVSGVAAIDFLKASPLVLSPDLPPVTLIARKIGSPAQENALPLVGDTYPVPAGATAVWLSEPAVRLYGHRPGEWMTLPIVQSSADKDGTMVFVAGMWRDYARQHGAIAIDNADYTRLTGDALRDEAAIVLTDEVTVENVMTELRDALSAYFAERATFALPGDIRSRALRLFDRSFAVTYLLEAIAVLVGLSGVAATFSAQTLARTKEFGMLRHIGMLRRQIVAMLAMEGALLGVVGVVAGIGLGLAISQVLIHVVNPQSFNWSMETRTPLALFVGVAVALIVAASATALLAGRRALSPDAVRAVREDW